MLKLLDARLATRKWIIGSNFTIADISLVGMVRNLVEFYQSGDLVGCAELNHAQRWLAAALARPAVKRGLTIPG
jgi:GSH-dependent disulfide-bond oxidoreductase